jgi:hypothetical protein
MASRVMGPPVLVVDDDFGTTETLGCYLASTGYGVRTAGTVADGCAIAKVEPCGLILSDLHFLIGLVSTSLQTSGRPATQRRSCCSQVMPLGGYTCDGECVILPANRP